MKNSLLALALLTGVSTSPMALESQPTNGNFNRFVFSYDFNNLQDPTLRQAQHLMQEMEYNLVRDVQQQRQHALLKIEQEVAIFADESEEVVAQL